MCVIRVTTSRTLVEKRSFMNLVNGLKFSLYCFRRFFIWSSSSSPNLRPSLVSDCRRWPSNSFRCWNTYSSMGSDKKSTSTPFFCATSRNGLFFTALTDSPAMK